MDDTISRQAAIDAVYERIRQIGYENNPLVLSIRQAIRELPSPSAQPEWIPCSERMPAEDEDVLISYRYKEGEGDASHINIDITSYGQMYFGGNKVGDYKHWRIPFEFFESNYEVIAWMPLPEPYKERRQDD